MPVYVQCKFRPEDLRSYTYVWDGEPLQKGDFVKVPDKSGEGWKRVTVVAISEQAPSYACKPILGLFNPDVDPDRAPDPAAGTPLDDDKILF